MLVELLGEIPRLIPGGLLAPPVGGLPPPKPPAGGLGSGSPPNREVWGREPPRNKTGGLGEVWGAAAHQGAKERWAMAVTVRAMIQKSFRSGQGP